VANISLETRTDMCDVLIDKLSGGTIAFYAAPMPVAPEVTPSGTALATLTFGSPAFSASVDGSATANAITGDSNAAGTALATWCRFFTSGGSGVLDVAIPADFVLEPTGQINSGDTVNISSLIITAVKTVEIN
jgi:hypothetical protein